MYRIFAAFIALGFIALGPPALFAQDHQHDEGQHDHGAHHAQDQHDHSSHHQMGGDHKLALCERFIPRDEVFIPTSYLKHPEWVMVHELDWDSDHPFRYRFYFDTTRPGLPIAAMTVASMGDSPVVRFTWEIEHKLRTIRIGTDEMICEKSPVVFGETRYDLGQLMVRLVAAKAKIQSSGVAKPDGGAK